MTLIIFFGTKHVHSRFHRLNPNFIAVSFTSYRSVNGDFICLLSVCIISIEILCILRKSRINENFECAKNTQLCIDKEKKFLSDQHYHLVCKAYCDQWTLWTLYHLQYENVFCWKMGFHCDTNIFLMPSSMTAKQKKGILDNDTKE